MKYIGDRFFPVRKMPCSAKDLFNDHCEWMEDEENEADTPTRSEKRGMTVRDVYKTEVLGDGTLFKDNDIETFSNENFLRYRYFLSYKVTRTKIAPKTIPATSTTGSFSSLRITCQSRNKRIARSARSQQRYWTHLLYTTTST
jgi:hypothetical protein